MGPYMPSPFFFFVLAVVVFVIVAIAAGVKTVPQAQEWTVERFGRYTKSLKPGLNLLIPFVDRVSNKVSMQETVLDVLSQDVITLDNAMITADGVLFFQIVDSAAAVYEVRNLERAISNLAMTNIRSVIGSMQLDDVLSKRDDINERLLKVIDAATNPWGIKVTRIEIKDLSPPADLVDSMARQMKAEREKRAEILTAEGEKQSQILRAEGQKQSQILAAEGRRESAFRDAEAREREGQAEASATKSVSEAIADGDVNAINYFVAQKYVGALEVLAAAPNQRVILLPMETSGILGSLAGIAELASAAFKSDGGGNSGQPKPGPASGPWERGES